MNNFRLPKFLLIIVLAFSSINLSATNLYWIGGTGNWGDSNHWSLSSGGVAQGAIPTASDNVFFDGNSFAAPTQTVNVDVVVNCLSMDWTGATFNPLLYCNYSINIYGSMTMIPGMSWTVTGGFYLRFKSTSTGNTITSGGLTIPNGVEIDGVGGEWTLQDDLYMPGTLELLNGILISNNKTITTLLFYSAGNASRGLILGNSVMNVTNASGGASWQISGTNFSLDAGNSTINNAGVQFTGGDQSYNNINFTSVTLNGDLSGGLGYNDVNFYGTSTLNCPNAYFNKLTFKKSATISGTNIAIVHLVFEQDAIISGATTIDTLTCAPGYAYNFSNTNPQNINNFEINGTCSEPVSLVSTVVGSRGTINCPNPSAVFSYLTIRDINFSGGANFIANNSINLGNNQGIAINAPVSQNLYWRGGTGNWSDPNHWSTTSGGIGGTCVPNQYDNVFFDANSFTGGSKIMTVNTTAYCKNMSWTGATSNPVFAGSGDLNVYGSLTLISAMTRTYNGIIIFKSTVAGNTITMANKTLANEVYFNGTGTWTLQDALTISSNALYLQAGNLNTNGKTVNCYTFMSTGTNSRSLTLGSSIFNINTAAASGYFYVWNINSTNFNLNAGTSTIRINCAGAGGPTVACGIGLNYYDIIYVDPAGDPYLESSLTSTFHNVTFNGNGHIYGGTFNKVVLNKNSYFNQNNTIDSLVFNTVGTTHSITSNDTQTVNKYLKADGQSGSLITINGGTNSFLSAPSCNVCCSYLNLTNVGATGGAQFYAANSTDGGNNTGWNFASCPSTTLTVGPVTGPANTCINGTNYIYSIPVVSGADSYVWTVPSGATILSGQNTNTIYVSVGSTAGTVSVSVTACGNTASANLPITVNPNPTITNISVTPATCSNADGTATATVTGGTPTYYYRWSSGDTLATAPALAAGQYQLLVFDIYGCRATANTSIVASDGPQISVVSTTPTSCNGGANATAQISVTGGTTPYVILWSNGASTLSTTGLTAGPYEVTVTDANECGASQSITITQPTAMTNSFTINPSACAGSTGSAQANVTGGTGVYTYAWDGSAANQTTSLASNLAAGVYQVVVTDANLCQTTFNATVPNTATTLTSAISGVVAGDCGPNSAGSATLDATGGAGSYVYLWSNGANTATISGVTPGNYYCTVTDASLCSSSQSVTIPSSVGNITQAICMVTVDTSTFTNQVIWEKLITNDIQSFKIYRESNIQNVYTAIATVPFTAISEYTDPVANPSIHAWRYKITAVDSCGVETPYSAPHKTIHLAQNLGVGGEINLAWDQYEGFPYYSYYIWRYDPSTGWEPLDTLSTNYTTYTDFVPPSVDSRYMVEVRPQSGCTSTMRLAGNDKDNEINTVVVKSKSNIKNNRTIGIKDSKNQETRLKVYPNPANEMLNIEVLMLSGEQAIITIENMLGQIVYTTQTNKPLNLINTINFMSGVYFVKVNIKNGIAVEKIIIE